MLHTHEAARFEGPTSPRGRAAPRLVARRAQAFCAPEHLLLGGVMVLGWAALIAWTGNGPVGWQARLCADAGTSLVACRTGSPSGGAPAQAGRVL